MRFDKLTIKSREAIEQMQKICMTRKNPECTSLHLLAALIAQGGIVSSLFERIGVKPNQVTASLEGALGRLPVVSGSDATISRELNTVLTVSQDLAQEMRDDYVSTEHFILAMTREQCEARDVLSALGIRFEDLLHALADVRGNQRS